MIRNFRNPGTADLFNGVVSKAARQTLPANLWRKGRQKLAELHAAAGLEDLRMPPGNRLEALRGDREGLHSIRINDRFRVCFRWTPAGPEAVEVVDDH